MERRKSKSEGSSKEKSSSSGKDIWSMLSDPHASTNPVLKEHLSQTKEPNDTYAIFAGAPHSGKSTIIQQFLNPNKDDKPKPTTMLDYTFGRRSVAGSNHKVVAHMWELAVNSKIQDIVRICMTPSRIFDSYVVIVVDISNPGDAIQQLLSWFDVLRNIVEQLLTEGSKLPEGKEQLSKLRKATAKRIASNHADADDIDPFPIPALVVVSKYDTFCDEDSIKRKVVAQALRYIAHVNGAGIQTMTTKDKTTVTQFRSVMNHYAFRTEIKGTREQDSAKGIVATAGTDSFEDIGIPRGAHREDFENGSVESRIKQWLRAVNEYYPASPEATKIFQDKMDEAEEEETPENEYREPSIDAMRAKKRDELLQYRKEVAKKSRVRRKSKS